MPLHRSKDSKGSYYQFGATGKKYYYQSNNTNQRNKAKEKAKRQSRAIEWSKHKRINI